MVTTLVSSVILIVAAWLLLRARKASQNSVDNDALLAQLEEMDASLNRLDLLAIESDRLAKELGIIPETPEPESKPTKTPTRPASLGDSDQSVAASTTSNSASSAPPRETSTIIRKRKSPQPPIPKTREEYEAQRKPLPPAPVYIPNANAIARFNEIYGISVNPHPIAVKNPPRKKLALLNFCLPPLRLASKFLSALLRAPKLIVNFFARPKLPPVGAESSPQKRAA